MTTKQQGLDSRTSSILINLNLNLNTGFVVNQYRESASKIEESSKVMKKKCIEICVQHLKNLI